MISLLSTRSLLCLAVAAAPLLLVVVQAQHQQPHSSSVVPDRETYSRTLSQVLDNELPQQDDRQLLGLGGNDGATGDRCGRLSGGDSCEAGLDCANVAVGKRCLPRQDCWQKEIEKFQASLNVDAFKQSIFQAANVTELDVLEARRMAVERGQDERAFVQSQPMQALMKALQANAGPLAKLDTVVAQCTSAPQTSNNNDVDNMDIAFVEDVDADDDDATTGGDMGQGTNNHQHRQLQSDWMLFPNNNTTTMSNNTTTSNETLFEDGPLTLEDDTETAPTATEEDADEDDNEASPIVYIGVHVEAGFFVADGSVSVFWHYNDLNDSPTFIRGCAGLELGGGAEVSFQVILAFTTNPLDIDCTSVLLDADASFTIGVGAAVGVCFGNMVYLDFTIGLGVGGGVGVAICEVWQA